METKNISYFRQNSSTNETIRILDCGYHETLQGHYSAQKVVDHYVLHCIISGKGTYEIHGKTYYLQANDCFLLLPNVPIRYQSDSENPWVYYWIGFDGTDALQLMQLCNITYQQPILHYGPISELSSVIHPFTILNTSSISDGYLALSMFYHVCSLLMKHNYNIKPLSRKEYYVNQAISLIENSYFSDISVQSISDSIGLDRTYLYRIFKEIVGITMQQYITNLRIKRARYFLANSDLSFSEVAYFCGYLSEQYFAMAFKKNVGMAPSVYRKLAIEKETHSE